LWRSRNHRGNDNTIPGKITESLEPTCPIVQERIPLDKGRVESVCIINEFLKVFIGDLGSKRRTPQILEEAIKTVGPESNDYVVLLGYIS
jgi:hypothetical protein